MKEALAHLRSLGKAVVFATNNAMRTRAEVAMTVEIVADFMIFHVFSRDFRVV